MANLGKLKNKLESAMADTEVNWGSGENRDRTHHLMLVVRGYLSQAIDRIDHEIKIQELNKKLDANHA